MRTYSEPRREKQANTIKGEGNPNWKGGLITKTCVRCSLSFQVYPSSLKQTHCSLACANRDMADAQRGVVNPKKIHYGEDNGMFGVSLPQKKGRESPNWKGGLSPIDKIIRSSTQYDNWRRTIFERDGFTCRTCFKKNCNLEAHHKTPVSALIRENNITGLESALTCGELWDTNNGITLCGDCHKRFTLLWLKSA